MIENFEKKKYESFGIDLHDFCKETMIKRFENVQVTGNDTPRSRATRYLKKFQLLLLEGFIRRFA